MADEGGKVVPRQALDDAKFAAGGLAIDLALWRRKYEDLALEANEEMERLSTLLVNAGIDPKDGSQLQEAGT
jgi:hypothetical protein